MASSDAGNYEIFLDTFKFRGLGAIKIPKTSNGGKGGRELYYELSVDIIITSTVGYDYVNTKVNPEESFYGYATLVAQDCLLPKIPLSFGRNRIFFQKIDEAYQQWQALAFWLNTEKKYHDSLFNLQQVLPADNIVCTTPPHPVSFREVFLREVRVKTSLTTQFEIEIGYVIPKKFTDDCGNEIDGKSRQTDDPKKDKGLPNGTDKPKSNPSDNPFGGNEPVSNLPSTSPFALDNSPVIVDPDLPPQPLRSKSCSVIVKTFATTPLDDASISGQLAAQYSYESVVLSENENFFVEDYADGTSATGISRAVRVSNDPPKYWLGDNVFVSTRTRFTQRVMTVAATCIFI